MRKLQHLISVVMATMALLTSNARADSSSGSGATREPTPEPESPSGVLLAGWLTLGGGVLALAGGAFTYSVGQAARDDDISLDRREEIVGRYTTVGTALLWLGAAATGTGITLVLLAPKDERVVQVSMRPGQLSLEGQF